MRKAVVGMVGVAVALMITACGAIPNAVQSFSKLCPPVYYSGLRWSPDGKYFAFVSDSEAEDPLLNVMNADMLGITTFIMKLPYTWRNLQWLPDSQTLAFTDIDKVIRVALNGTTDSIDIPLVSIDRLIFSPDGKTMAFHGHIGYDNSPSAGLGIHLVNQDGSGLIDLTASGFDELEHWSPDGEQIAVSKYGGFVYVVRVDGSEKRNLTKGVGPVRWSPDGQWLSFISTQDERLHIIRPDGTDERTFAPEIVSTLYSWLPDSRHIALAPSPDRFLSVIDVNTSTVEIITQSDVAHDSPIAWSPDGRRVVFISDGLNSSVDIYVVNRDGSGEIRLTDNPGRYQCFNWPF